MPRRKAHGPFFDPKKIEAAMQRRIGTASRNGLHKLLTARYGEDDAPSLSTVRNACDGKTMEREEYRNQIAEVLGTTFDELRIATAPSISDLLRRVRDQAFVADSAWSGSTEVMRSALDGYESMKADLQSAEREFHRLDQADKAEVGMFAAALAGCIHTFGGEGADSESVRAIKLAARCAHDVESSSPEIADRILADHYHNFTGRGMGTWMRPDEAVSLGDAEQGIRNFRHAEHYYRTLKPGPDGRFGPTGVETIEQVLCWARLLVKCGSLGEACRQLDRSAEMIPPTDRYSLGTLFVLRSQLEQRGESRRKPRPAAVDHMREAKGSFEKHYGTQEHHLVAGCVLRLHQFRAGTTRELEPALLLFDQLGMPGSHIVDRDDVARRHAGFFAKLPRDV